MKELYQEMLDNKYYYVAKGGHFFIYGLLDFIMVDNREVAEYYVDMIQREYGLDEIKFTTKASICNEIRAVDKKIERMKLYNRLGAVEMIKILDNIRGI